MAPLPPELLKLIYQHMHAAERRPLVPALADSMRRCTFSCGPDTEIPTLPRLVKFPNLSSIHLELSPKRLAKILQPYIKIDCSPRQQLLDIMLSRTCDLLEISGADTVTFRICDQADADIAADFLPKFRGVNKAYFLSQRLQDAPRVEVVHPTLRHLTLHRVLPVRIDLPQLHSANCFYCDNGEAVLDVVRSSVTITARCFNLAAPRSDSLHTLHLAAMYRGQLRIHAPLINLKSLELSNVNVQGRGSDALADFPGVHEVRLVNSRFCACDPQQMHQSIVDHAHVESVDVIWSDLGEEEAEAWEEVIVSEGLTGWVDIEHGEIEASWTR